MLNDTLSKCQNIVQLLYQRGCRNVSISPGLRNTAISLSFINHKGFKCYSIIDERSAGFFALGLTLKSKTPTILICTSGTALANYFPSIIESSQSRVPIIIITADRPKNLINTGENQTINQTNIYGDFVRNNYNINIKQDKNQILKQIDNSYFISIGEDYDNLEKSTPGPVHINIHLDDFTNSKLKENLNINLDKKIQIKSSFKKMAIPNYKKYLIVIGRLNEEIDEKMITKLSKHLKAPIFADSLSQIRFNNNHVLSLYDHYLNDETIVPDMIIRFGQKPVSKNLCIKLNQWKNKTILIDEYGRFNDNCGTIVKGNYTDSIKHIIHNTKENTNLNFYSYFQSMDKIACDNIDTLNQWSELIIAKLCLLSLNNNENLFVGNSMPIRYMDMINPKTIKKDINIYSNRGASGIDGLIATSLGVAKSTKQNTLLLVGDVSFIHDQNSLLIAKHYNINITIVIINNSGGGIFSLLPLSKSIKKSIFNQYWNTSPDLNLKNIAKLYEFNYSKVNSIKQLSNALNKYKKSIGVDIIDAHVDIQENKKILNQIKKG